MSDPSRVRATTDSDTLADVVSCLGMIGAAALVPLITLACGWIVKQF